MESFNVKDVKDRLIVALDVNSEDKALELVNQLKGRVGLFKVGSQLFTAFGPPLVNKIISQGEKVFLDLKFHDIPNTVSSATIEAAKLGVYMVNLHSMGGIEMMQQCVKEVADFCQKEGIRQPIILAVTILTSLDQSMLAQLGIEVPLIEQVIKLASLAQEAGLDGVICSPQEVITLRQALSRDFILVTPGIRPSWSITDDQRRINTPAQALAKGADYLVIGRPITRAESPAEALEKIMVEIKEGLSGGKR